MTHLRITDVARRAGYRTSTLRYYERIGVLPAPHRSAAGYRLYDEAALDRLALVTRAKHLGCTLEEITDLVETWDRGRCAEVHERLRSAVADKLVATRDRMQALHEFAGELRDAAATLNGTAPGEGPCTEQCTCVASGVASGSPGEDAVALVASVCTLDPDARPARVEEWHRLMGFVTGRKALDGGVRLVVDPSVSLPELVRVSAAEQECCDVFAFALTLDSRGIALEVRVRPGAEPLLAALFGLAPADNGPR